MGGTAPVISAGWKNKTLVRYANTVDSAARAKNAVVQKSANTVNSVADAESAAEARFVSTTGSDKLASSAAEVKSANTTEPGSTALVAVAVDQFGNILASIGAGGGNTSTTVDTPKESSTGVTFVQVFGRDPAGNVVGVPASSTGALGDTINPITNVPITTTDERSTENQFPIPVILCGRIAPGYANAGAIVAVALDSTGALCISGSSGSSTTPTQVQTFENGECALIQLYGRNSSGQLVSVPLNTAGSLLLN
jgi:hypothetical protein